MGVLNKGIWEPNKEEADLFAVDKLIMPEDVEADKYHLYMSLACPFAHRPYAVIKYLGLDHVISVSSVAAKRHTGNIWLFDDEYPDPLNNSNSLVELYQKTNPSYSGEVAVPTLLDKHSNKVVCNDSAIMALSFATTWLPLAKNKFELVPEELKDEILLFNEWLHNNINRKVYHVGFARNQTDYDIASEILFDSLDKVNNRLENSRYLHGDEITLSDLFLMPSLVRFETVYAIHFKANKRSIKDFEFIYNYLLSLMKMPTLRETVDIRYSKTHYYFSHKHINPTRIIPAGPEIKW